jgi:hypothetical protein
MNKWVGALLFSLVLSGCASSAGPDAGDGSSQEDFDDLDLDATSTTGIVRGLVVDDRIVPIPDAAVALRAPDGEQTATTDAQGRFGFDDLPAGTYFISASKLNYESVQTAVEVVAGEDDPAPVRVLLTRLFSVEPFSFTTKFEGFIQCGYEAIIITSLCLNDYETILVPDIPPTLKEVFDNRGYVSALDGNWSTLVFELTWEPTAQGTSEEMFLLVSYWNRTASDWYGQEGGEPPVVMLRFEAGEDHASSSGDVIPEEGLPDLYAYGGIQGSHCVVGCVGLGFSQDFTIFQTNFFYGKPPEGWSFVAGDQPPF